MTHARTIDSNAAQFERRGDAWIAPRDQQELRNSPVSRGQMRRNRQIKPCQRTYATPTPTGRTLTPEEQKAQAQRAMLAHVTRLGKAMRGAEIREVTGYQPKRVEAVIKPAAEAELSEWHPSRIEHQRLRLAREAEQVRADADRVKAAMEADVWAGFAEAMAGALAL